ncbi:phosphoglycerate kinase, partial [Candidatus Daviesbacteria bacterium]|nr:phosphoglycerate kinase [Candidatus Daviesbacteria bacterium]
MVEVTPELISGKRVLLRYDIDVVLHPLEDFKLKAGLNTLRLCLEHATKVILMGHLGRPTFAEATAGKPDKFFVPKYSIAPIVEWFKNHNLRSHIVSGKLVVLENLRFDPREEAGDLNYAKELAQKGDFYINEAFSSYRPAVSTTVLPT